jgi:hypothetical protein
LVKVALQTSHAIAVVAREKIVDSLPQSRQLTFRKLFVIFYTSLVNQFEFLSTLARGIVGFAGFSAPVENVNSLGWLFTTVRLWTWETTVSSHDTTETALTPAKFGGASLLNALNGVHGMLASRRTVALDLSGSLDHVNT